MSTTKSILFVASYAGLGGGEWRLLEDAREATKHWDRVEVMAEPGDFVEAEARRMPGVTYTPLRIRGSRWRPFSVCAARRIARRMRAERFDAVVGVGTRASLHTRLAKRWSGVPCRLILNNQGYHFLRPLRGAGLGGWLRRRVGLWLERATRDLVDVATFLSPEDLDSARNEVGYTCPTYLVTNGADPARVEPARTAALPGDLAAWYGAHRVVISVAALTEVKGHRTVFAAFADVRKRFPDAGLLLVGAGPARKSLEKAAAAAGLAVGADVVFAGARPPAVVDALHIRAAASVLASWEEPWGMVVTEAMMLGVPLVCADVSGPRVQLDGGRCGRLFPPGDAPALARALTEVLEKRPEEQVELARERALTLYDRALILAACDRVYRGLPPTETA